LANANGGGWAALDLTNPKRIENSQKTARHLAVFFAAGE
jgi:hypothetical protein